MKKSQKKGYSEEKRRAKKHRGTHVGGPGKPDYTRGKIKGEIKNTKSKVHSGIIKDVAKKKIKEIDSKSGFTGPAIEEAKKRGIKLISRGKEVT